MLYLVSLYFGSKIQGLNLTGSLGAALYNLQNLKILYVILCLKLFTGWFGYYIVII